MTARWSVYPRLCGRKISFYLFPEMLFLHHCCEQLYDCSRTLLKVKYICKTYCRVNVCYVTSSLLTESSCIRWRRQWHPTPVLLPGKSHGRRSLVGCSPWGRWGLDTTERLHFHFLLSCIGEGNGNPLQCCCLENPRDGGAWWAAIYGVPQSGTRLKWLSSSSSSCIRKRLWILVLCLFMGAEGLFDVD